MRENWVNGTDLSPMPAMSRPSASEITLTGSPFTYTVPRDGAVIISGGIVSLVEYGRNGAFTVCGLITGSVNVVRGDSVRITYVVAPNATFLPW